MISSGENIVAYDAYTRLLQRIPPDSQALWQEVESLVEKATGILIIDDTTLDKPYAEKMAMVTSHWSGKHHAVVMGINLISLLWTDGEAHLTCDFRFYNHAQDGLTKNDHFRNMLTVLLVFNGEDWTNYSFENSDIPFESIEAMTIDAYDRIWIGDWGVVISALEPNGTWNTYTPMDGTLPGSLLKELVVDPQGRIWVGTDEGINVFTPPVVK